MCRILDTFTPEDPELGVREIARATGLTPSTAGRLLQGMREHGILQQDPRSRAYRLGIKILNWSGVYLSALDIRSISLPFMADLQRLSQETISLYLLDGGERVCVERLESPQRVRIVARLGIRLPLHAGSAGKAILAYLPEDRLAPILAGSRLQSITRHTITDPRELREELARIRNQGYAASQGEWIEDASGVAAPLFSADRQVMGALTISGPTQRFSRTTMERYGRQVAEAAGEISRQMGYTQAAVSADRTRI